MNLKEKSRTLVGDVLLAAAFVSYIGAFNQKFRTDLWQGFWVPDLNKKEIPLTPEITPVKVLATVRFLSIGRSRRICVVA